MTAQLENGYTRIANELMEVISRTKLNGSQFRIILAVVRHTYGFNRSSAEMSISYLSNATGLPERHVRKELDRLLRERVLIEYKKPTKTSSREIGINKNHNEWFVCTSGKDTPEVQIDQRGEVQLLHSGEEQLLHSGEEQLHPQERQLKENIKDSIKDRVEKGTPYQQIVDIYHELCQSFPKLRSLSNQRKKHISARWKQHKDISVFQELFIKAEASDFMKGYNDRAWKADFDWMMNETNFAKILEGKYDNKRRGSPGIRETVVSQGQEETDEYPDNW
jgi:phage replication O-like protein O